MKDSEKDADGVKILIWNGKQIHGVKQTGEQEQGISQVMNQTKYEI